VFQFSFAAIWCLGITEGALLLFYALEVHSTDPHWGMLPVVHLFGFPPLLAAMFGGYCFNKFVIVHPNDLRDIDHI
jgi:hypothetical protein